jgi:hypothetical protein
MRKLKRNKIKLRASDFPSLLYPKDGYDPDDVETKLLQNPIALRVSDFVSQRVDFNARFLVLSFYIHIARIGDS